MQFTAAMQGQSIEGRLTSPQSGDEATTASSLEEFQIIFRD